MGRRVSLRIHYKRRSDLAVSLILALLVVAFLGCPAWGQKEVAASNPQVSMAASTSTRRYYLTKGTYGGANASTACASGYHMASLWEILDPSCLEYDTDLGYMRDDSGSGPPSFGGWVRTGYMSHNGDTAGRANCSAWTTASGYGTTALLPDNWTAGSEDIHAWNVFTGLCSGVAHVWCVEDKAGFDVFLPLVMRDFL